MNNPWYWPRERYHGRLLGWLKKIHDRPEDFEIEIAYMGRDWCFRVVHHINKKISKSVCMKRGYPTIFHALQGLKDELKHVAARRRSQLRPENLLMIEYAVNYSPNVSLISVRFY